MDCRRWRKTLWFARCVACALESVNCIVKRGDRRERRLLVRVQKAEGRPANDDGRGERNAQERKRWLKPTQLESRDPYLAKECAG